MGGPAAPRSLGAQEGPRTTPALHDGQRAPHEDDGPVATSSAQPGALDATPAAQSAPAEAGGSAAPQNASAAPAPSAGLTYDQALAQYVGDFGRGQILNFVLASLVWIPNAMLILQLVFSMGTPVRDRAWECTDAADAACAAVLASASPEEGFCRLRRDQWAWTRPGDALVSQFDLVCGDAWKSQASNSFFFVGYLIGSGVFGQLSDAYGRKACMFGAAVISAVFAAAGVGCPTYWGWLAVRALSGVGAAGTALGAYILATEAIGERWRGAMGIACQIFFIFGEFLLVGAATVFPTWRGQAFSVAIVNAAVLLLWPLIPESGRWLLAQGRKAEALRVLERFARLNGTRPPDTALADMALADGAKRLTLGSALRDWHIARRSLVLAYAWMVICMTYYGISFALSSLGGSLAVSFMVSSVAELPSYLFSGWAIDRFGRHNTMGGTMLLGGAACVGCAFMPAGGGQMALASIGKFGVAGAFAIASIYTSELFPTLIRSAVLGAVNQAARVGGIIAPFIALAGAATNSGLVPFLTFGASCLLGGLLIFTLPETLGTPLPDTMADMGVIASIFTNGTLKKGLKAAAASMFKVRVKLPGRGASRWSRLSSGGAGKAAGGGNRPGKQCSVWTEDEVGIVEEEAGVREDVEALIIATHRAAAPAGSSAAALQAGAGAGSGSGGGGSSTGGPAARA